MEKHELLVPAGDMACLRQAVFNGCDAVYLACKNFGARKFATNFTNEEIVEAIKFCHLYGVKLYVTMNTLVKNSEVDQFLEQAFFLHESGVDALIVQDFGMICLLKKMYPNLEIHASTQANISSSEVCKLYYDLGVKRVVFARELSIDEIDSIAVPIEKEAFIHGALCISYSGCCLMSSMLGGRSGNRGECAGCCRMPFKLERGGEVISSGNYLLSTKELNTVTEIDRLKKSSIYSFKIEGRMKSPLYVGFITNLYRRLIDGEKVDLDYETDRLKTIFNREFTVGRLFNVSDKEFMNIKSPNHIGLRIGRVVDFVKDKIKIELDDNQILNQYDAIRFLSSNKGFVVNFLYDKKMNLVNSSNKICYVDNKVGLQKNDIVCKTQDYLLNAEFENVVPKKINISFRVKARLGSLLVVEISDGINKFSIESDVIQESINAPVAKENIIRQLSKLGDTPFICRCFDIEIDKNIFIPLRDLNEIRRSLVAKLIDKRENSKAEVVVNRDFFDNCLDESYVFEKNRSCYVNNREQLDACLEIGINRIYVNNRELYEEYKSNDNIYLVIPRCNFNITDKLGEKSFVSDYFDFSLVNCIGNYTLNVTNIYTAYFLKLIGLKTVTLSVELSEDEIIDFIDNYNKAFGKFNFEVLCYGLIENMIIKGNILNLDVGCLEYKLIDFKNRVFPVYYDGECTHILNYEYRDFQRNILEDKCSLRYDFFDENKVQIKNVVNKY